MAIEAGSKAVADAGIAPSEVGAVIVATCSMPTPITNAAARVADGIGAGPVPDPVYVTVSIGVAVLDETRRDLTDLLAEIAALRGRLIRAMRRGLLNHEGVKRHEYLTGRRRLTPSPAPLNLRPATPGSYTAGLAPSRARSAALRAMPQR